MKRMHFKLLVLAFLALFHADCFAQEIWPYGRSKQVKRDDSLSVRCDTLTLDTLIQNYKTGQRIWKSKENIELSKGSIYGGMGSKCGCEAIPHGWWIKRHRNGNLKETGELFCTRKVGTWHYFYENGALKKVETYQKPYIEFMTEEGMPWDTLRHKESLIGGLYTEFYENGNLKSEGRYEIVEEFSTIDTLITLHPETYEAIFTPITGEFWIPKTVKIGWWKELDENGNLLKGETFDPPWIQDKRYRPIASRFYEFFETQENSRKGK